MHTEHTSRIRYSDSCVQSFWNFFIINFSDKIYKRIFHISYKSVLISYEYNEQQIGCRWEQE